MRPSVVALLFDHDYHSSVGALAPKADGRVGALYLVSQTLRLSRSPSAAEAARQGGFHASMGVAKVGNASVTFAHELRRSGGADGEIVARGWRTFAKTAGGRATPLDDRESSVGVLENR